MPRVLIAGSFDPFTKGHLFLVQRALDLFGQVTVAVLDNREKTYLFSLEEREQIAKRSCSGLSGVNVLSSHEMLYEFCKKHRFDSILKGVRDEKDCGYELLQAEYNRAHGVETILIPSPAELAKVNATYVREQLKAGAKENCSDYISEEMYAFLERLLKEKEKKAER